MGRRFTGVNRNSAEPEWKAIHRVADKAKPRLQAVHLRAMQHAQGKTPVIKIENALRQRDVAEILRLVPVEEVIEERLRPALVSELLQTLQSGGRVGSTPAEIKLRFDITNPRAVHWVEEHSGKLIRQISQQTHAAIRTVILNSFQDGIPPRDTARLIRGVIGLTEKQSAAVMNYRRLLQKAPVDADRIRLLVDAYQAKLVRQRAETIARTETITASNEGQRHLWQQAVDQGLLVAADWERSWITTPDDRLCPLCLAMEDQRAPIAGPFPSGVMGPTLHPRCRCAVGLVRVAELRLVA